MKLIITFLIFLGLFANLNLTYAASSGGSKNEKSSFYKSGKKLIIRYKFHRHLLTNLFFVRWRQFYHLLPI